MDKESLRRPREEADDGGATGLSPGRIAEQVRRLAAYRATKALFVGPAPLLRQIRINTLGDGKRLVMPASGLLEGFWSLAPFALPFAALPQAVTPQGIATRGERLTLPTLAGQQIALLVTDALAVDRNGVMVADGKGFFDLATAILQQAGALAAPFTVVAITENFVGDAVVDDAQPWDVRADVVIHPGGMTELAVAREAPAIFWETLPARLVRRITPLWQLSQQGRAAKAE